MVTTGGLKCSVCGDLEVTRSCIPEHLNCIMEIELHGKNGGKSDGGGPRVDSCGREGQPAQSEADGVEDRAEPVGRWCQLLPRKAS